MFGNAAPGYQPSQLARDAAKASFDALVAVVRECRKAGVLKRSADPGFVAEILIAAAHDAVSPKLSGRFEDANLAGERFSVLCGAALAPFLA